MTMTKEVDARIHHQIEDAITFMLLCEQGFGVGDMSFFDGAMPGYGDVWDGIFAAHSNLATCFELAGTTNKLHGSMLMGPEDDRTHMIIVGASELDLRARQRVIARSPGRIKVGIDEHGQQMIGYDKINSQSRIVEVRATAIEHSGATRKLCQNYFIRDHKRQSGILRGWNTAHGNTWFGEGKHKDYNYECMGFAIAACATTISREYWQVLVRFGGQRPGIKLFTDATGIKDFFRFREVPEGKSRRDALVHWVGEHWRQNRYDPDVEHYVREHLRGSYNFNWHNLSGMIELPEPEQKREQVAIETRRRLCGNQLARRRQRKH